MTGESADLVQDIFESLVGIIKRVGKQKNVTKTKSMVLHWVLCGDINRKHNSTIELQYMVLPIRSGIGYRWDSNYLGQSWQGYE